VLRILAGVVAGLVGLFLLVVVIGYTLPRHHVAARAISLSQKPADVFTLISNFKDGPAWRESLQQVDLLPDRDGHARFREKSTNGAITMEVVESTPPRRLVTRIDDKEVPFGGVWIFEVSPTAEGSRLNITERGEVYNPVFRFVARFIIGYHATLDTYLRSVARKFGENSSPVDGTIAQR
jgi:uncharacterized protein YndB with AHSA1/START domain